jgi:branched-chain amino acid transport system substrate-binding protein
MLSRDRFTILPLALVTLVGCNRNVTPAPILLGHVVLLSGSNKTVVEHAKQAIYLAVEEANQPENRIQGRLVKVLEPDAQANLDSFAGQAVRLVTVNAVAGLFGGTDLAQAERLGRAVRGHEIVVVTPAALPPQLLDENMYSINAGLAFQGRVLARFAAQELQADRAAQLVDSQQPACTTVANAFAREFQRLRGNPVEDWAYKTEADQTRVAERLKKDDLKAVLYVGSVSDLGKLRTSLRNASKNLPVLVGGSATLSALQTEPAASSGVYVTTPYTEGAAVQGQDFVRRYQERYHESPSEAAALAYDGVRVLLDGLRRAKSPQPALLRTALANLDNKWDSLTGPLRFDKDHVARRSLFVIRLKEGRPEASRRYDAEE